MRHAGKEINPDNPLLVGVINISPESFFKGSVAETKSSLEKKIEEFNAYEVDCLDVGAMSTRPIEIYGGERAGIEEEKTRVKTKLPLIMDIATSYNVPVAIDTQYQEVAALAIDNGVEVVNDISGLKTDENLAGLLADTGVDVVVMATRVKPGDVCGIDETLDSLRNSLQIADTAGIKRSKIAIDPGFGGWQGRPSTCDLDLIKNFSRLQEINLPIYVGISRKSTIKTLGGGQYPDDRLPGSLILTQWMINHGASIIRTHDVKETRLALNVAKTLDQLSTSS